MDLGGAVNIHCQHSLYKMDQETWTVLIWVMTDFYEDTACLKAASCSL